MNYKVSRAKGNSFICVCIYLRVRDSCAPTCMCVYIQMKAGAPFHPRAKAICSVSGR